MLPSHKFSRWLTSRRIRTHALLLALVLWSAYAFDMSTPGLLDRNSLVKGPDFLPFYTLGRLALAGRGDLLYDMPAQMALRQSVVGPRGSYAYLPFYGPQASLLFAPFAELSYGYALAAWLFLSTLIYAMCCYAVWKTCPYLQDERVAVFLAAVAFPGFFHLITFGQSSALPLLCFTLTYLALRANKPFLAGLAFGSLVIKPHLALAGAILFLLTRQWKVVLAAILAAAAQLGIGWQHYGTPVMRSYVHALLHSNDFPALLEPKLYQAFSLRGFWLMLVPSPLLNSLLYASTGALVIWIMFRAWRRTESLDLRYSALLLATVLVSPHSNAYDLVILAPAFLLITNFALAHSELATTPALKLLLYFCYPLFLVLPLTKIIHIQLGVVAIVFLLWLIAEIRIAPGIAAGTSSLVKPDFVRLPMFRLFYATRSSSLPKGRLLPKSAPARRGKECTKMQEHTFRCK